MESNQNNSPQDNQNKQNKRDKRQTVLTSLIVLAIWVAMFYLAERPAQTASQQATVELSQVASEVTAGQVQKITVQGDTLNVKKTDGSRQAARKESSVSAPQALKDLGVAPEALSKVAFEVNGPSGLDA